MEEREKQKWQWCCQNKRGEREKEVCNCGNNVAKIGERKKNVNCGNGFATITNFILYLSHLILISTPCTIFE